MTSKRRGFFLFLLFLLFLLTWTGMSPCHSQQAVVEKDVNTPQMEAPSEKIVGAPQDIKQKTGIWVFVVWMWTAVFVLIYFIRLKIEESDRLYRLRFFSAKKD